MIRVNAVFTIVQDLHNNYYNATLLFGYLRRLV